MGKTHFGTCAVCGKRKNLTFEHIPPKATGNNQQVKFVADSTDIFKHGMENFESFKMKFGSQKGTGDYTLCSSCNNFLGSKYVDEFVDFSNPLGYYLQKIWDRPKLPILGHALHVKVNVNLFRFQKQVISMMMSLTGGAFSPDFREYLLDEDDRNFPWEKYLLTMNIQTETRRTRTTGQMAVVDADLGIQMMSEYQFFPFGFTLYNLEKSSEKMKLFGLDISNFSQLPDEKKEVELDIPISMFLKEMPVTSYEGELVNVNEYLKETWKK